MKRLIAVLSSGLLTACPPPAPPPAPAPGPRAEPAPEPASKPSQDRSRMPTGDYEPLPALEGTVRSVNHFGAAIYARLRERSGNLALSPASLSVALGMTYAGAGGATAEQMKRVAGFEGDRDTIHRGFGTLLRQWAPDPKMPVELRVASRLYSDEALPVKPAYRKVTRSYYEAPIEQLDFAGAPESARQTINDWVADRTEGRIDPLLPEGSLDPRTRLVLTNAVYFEGAWGSPFEEKRTEERPFFTPGGRVEVPTMRQTAFFRYAEIDGAKLLEMPYEGGRWSMVFVLPDDRDGLSALEARMDEAALSDWLEGLERWKVRVSLPRFTVEPAEPYALSETLRAMGMTDAFDPEEADLSAIAEPEGPRRLFVSEVFHDAFVKVDEKGTEAAAATGATMSVTSLPMPTKEPKVFSADHPFAFLIRDRRLGAILFMGRVADPSR